MIELGKIPEHENGIFSKAIAEWADGDSIACHVAVGGDYFCTRDIAKSAGNKSVLSKQNLKWLKDDYNVNVISPESISREIMKQSQVTPNKGRRFFCGLLYFISVGPGVLNPWQGAWGQSPHKQNPCSSIF